MNNTEEKENQKDKPKEKKVYLSSNINNDIQKQNVEHMKKVIVENSIYTYTGQKMDGIEYQLFYRYLESRTKPNKSPNSFNIRIERLYNTIVDMYSDFIQDYGDILKTTKHLMNGETTKTIVDNNDTTKSF